MAVNGKAVGKRAAIPRNSLIGPANWHLSSPATVLSPGPSRWNGVVCVKFSKIDHGVRLSHPLGAAVARLPKA